VNNSILLILVLVFCFGVSATTLAEVGMQDIDHPYLSSDEYKKNVEDIRQKETELQHITSELNELQNERKHFSWGNMSFILGGLSFLPLFSLDSLIAILLLSLFLAVVYFLYLKKYNPAKWFILFKSNGNLALLLKRMKDHNSLMLVLIVTLLLSPAIGLAGTDVLTDAKYFLFGNELEKAYITVKYPKAGIEAPYSTLKGIKIYQKFADGSFEQQFNLAVCEFALDSPPKTADAVQLIEKVRTVENLHTVYDLVFRLDAATMKDVVRKRLSVLPKLRSDAKYDEVEIILAKCREINSLGLVADDLAAALNQMLPDVTGTAGTLRFAAILVDVDPARASEVFDRVKYHLKEIIGDKDNELRFKTVYLALSKIRPNIYKPDDSFQLEDQGDGMRVLVAALFNNTDDRIASTITRNLRLERSTHLNQKEYEALIDLWKKYRNEEAPAFFDVLTATFINHGMSNIGIFMNFAARLGYSEDAAADALIKQDSDYHGLRLDQSTLISKEFIAFLSPECLGRNFEYFKTRTAQAKIILDGLFQKREDLFSDYLRYCYEKDPQLLTDLAYANKLAGFSKWNGIISNQSFGIFRVPGCYYLASKDFLASPPDPQRAKVLLQRNADDRLKSLIIGENNLDDLGFLDELMLYHLYSGSSDPQAVERKIVLESSIGTQARARMSQRISALDSQIKGAGEQVYSLKSELSTMKGRKLSVHIRIWIASILFSIVCLYILTAFVLSLKYATNAVASYSGTRVGLFAAVFAETFSKFLVPILYFTVEALFVIIVVQLFGFLRSGDREYPNVQRSLRGYLDGRNRSETGILRT